MLTFLVTSCGPIEIKSANEPKDDASAFALAGFTATPPAKVVFQSFDAGMDDSMCLVFDLEKTHLPAFWETSPFTAESRKEHFPKKAGANILDSPSLPSMKEVIWNKWNESTHGIFSKAELPKGRFVKLYIDLDASGMSYRGYLFWHET